MAEETALGGRQQKPAWVWYAVLAILVFTVFGRSVFYDFLQWDDRLLILENTKVNPRHGWSRTSSSISPSPTTCGI
jgi:hypothetical protein